MYKMKSKHGNIIIERVEILRIAEQFYIDFYNINKVNDKEKVNEN